MTLPLRPLPHQRRVIWTLPLFPCCTSGFGSKELQGEDGHVLRVFSGHFPTFGFRHGRHIYWHPGYRPHLIKYQIDRSPGPNCDQLATDRSGPFFLAYTCQRVPWVQDFSTATLNTEQRFRGTRILLHYFFFFVSVCSCTTHCSHYHSPLLHAVFDIHSLGHGQ